MPIIISNTRLTSVGANVNVIRFIVLEINDIKSLHLDAVCIVSRVLEMIIGTKVIVTNDINSFDYDKYLRTEIPPRYYIVNNSNMYNITIL